MATIDSLPDPVSVDFSIPKDVVVFLAGSYGINIYEDDSAQALKQAIKDTIIQRARAKGMGTSAKSLMRLANKRGLSPAEMAEVEAEINARGEDPPEPAPE